MARLPRTTINPRMISGPSDGFLCSLHYRRARGLESCFKAAPDLGAL